jgi:hypothetical protein
MDPIHLSDWWSVQGSARKLRESTYFRMSLAYVIQKLNDFHYLQAVLYMLNHVSHAANLLCLTRGRIIYMKNQRKALYPMRHNEMPETGKWNTCKGHLQSTPANRSANTLEITSLTQVSEWRPLKEPGKVKNAGQACICRCSKTACPMQKQAFPPSAFSRRRDDLSSTCHTTK